MGRKTSAGRVSARKNSAFFKRGIDIAFAFRYKQNL